jgi:hypothetical protein
MPTTELILFQEANGDVPLMEWLESLPPQAKTKCEFAMELLAKFGHELRRPKADYLRDGIYELRIGLHGKNYRILYSFIGQQIVLLSHGIIKESRVPPTEIERALSRRDIWKLNPNQHSFKEK